MIEYYNVRNIIMNHIGRENAISSIEIAKMLKIVDDAGTRAKTRTLIRKTALYFSLPILSCKKGYYLAGSIEELLEYSKSMDKRINAIMERKKSVVKNYLEYQSQYTIKH